MQTNVWALEKKNKWGLLKHSWMKVVLLFTHVQKILTMYLSGHFSPNSEALWLQPLLVLDSGEINVLHSLCWRRSCNSSLTEPGFRSLSHLKEGGVEQKLGMLLILLFI